MYIIASPCTGKSSLARRHPLFFCDLDWSQGETEDAKQRRHRDILASSNHTQIVLTSWWSDEVIEKLGPPVLAFFKEDLAAVARIECARAGAENRLPYWGLPQLETWRISDQATSLELKGISVQRLGAEEYIGAYLEPLIADVLRLCKGNSKAVLVLRASLRQLSRLGTD